MTREEAIKTLKENLCNICSYHGKNMESCDIAYCDNRAAIRTLEQETCEDAVSREAILKEIPRLWNSSGDKDYCMETLRDFVVELLPVTPKGVTVTDFADKCRECGKQKNGKWIPVSERLPKDRDWYLGIFKEPDTGWINPIPYICDYVGCETKATTKDYWILNGFTNEDEHIDYYFNLECVAWMPVPEPYKEEGEE